MTKKETFEQYLKEQDIDEVISVYYDDAYEVWKPNRASSREYLVLTEIEARAAVNLTIQGCP